MRRHRLETVSPRLSLEPQRTVRPNLDHQRVRWLLLAVDELPVQPVVAVPVRPEVVAGAAHHLVGAALEEPEEAGRRVVIAVPGDLLMPDDQAALGEAEDFLVPGDQVVDTLGMDRPEAEHDGVGLEIGADRQETLGWCAAPGCPVRAPGRLARRRTGR